MPILKPTDYETIPAGVYPATLTGIEEFVDPQWGPKFRWKFEVRGKKKTATVSQRTSQAFSPKSNARKIVEGLLGRSLAKGESINTDDLIGTECQVIVTVDEKDTGTFNNIERVMSLNASEDDEESPF